MDSAILTKVFDLIEKSNAQEKEIDGLRADIIELQRAYNDLIRQLSAPAPQAQSQE